MFAFFDTETTALVKNALVGEKFQPRIIEFFGVLTADDSEFSILERCHFVCNPGIPISKEVTAITGFTDERVKNEPPFGMFMQQVRDFFQKAHFVVAHNLSYDKYVVDYEMRRNNQKPIDWPEWQICTVEQTEWIKGYRLSLTGLHEFLFNKAFTGAHSAEHDVLAMHECYKELYRRKMI